MSDTIVKPISAQKVRAVLRKAGLIASTGHRSGMVRGWTTWSTGFRVRDLSHGDAIWVWFQRDLGDEQRRAGLQKCFEALAAYQPILDEKAERIVISKAPVSS